MDMSRRDRAFVMPTTVYVPGMGEWWQAPHPTAQWWLCIPIREDQNISRRLWDASREWREPNLAGIDTLVRPPAP